MKEWASKGTKINGFSSEIDWEVRPGGMLVQKRNLASSAIFITIKVSHDSYLHHLTISAQSTFGDLKRVLSSATGLEPKDQRLLFKGKEKENDECLHMAGVNDQSKVILLEDPASRELNKKTSLSKSYEAIAGVRTAVDKLSEKVGSLEREVCGGGDKVEDSEFNAMIESLMAQLLKLDAIEAGGHARVQKRDEVRRVQSYIDKVDNLKARKANPLTKQMGEV